MNVRILGGKVRKRIKGERKRKKREEKKERKKEKTEKKKRELCVWLRKRFTLMGKQSKPTLKVTGLLWSLKIREFKD